MNIPILKKTILFEVPVDYYMDEDGKKYKASLNIRGSRFTGSSELNYEDAIKELQNAFKKNYPDYYGK